VTTHEGDPDKGRHTSSQYLYDGLNLLSVSNERIRTDSGAFTARWQITYLYDAGGRPYAGIYHDLKTTDPQEGTPQVFLIVTNERGDVLELLNANHSAIVAYRYDVWGVARSTHIKPHSDLGAALADRNLLRYAGYAYDDYSGLYYLQRRYYDTVTRSFISRDPGRADGLESPYQYCGGRPVSETDPTGQFRGGKLWYEPQHRGLRNTPSAALGEFVALITNWHPPCTVSSFLETWAPK
jgi:RHS repeat-associated protein